MQKHHGLAHAVDQTRNAKLGLASVTYASQNSCPTTCPFRGSGCYAEQGPTGIWTRKVNDADPAATPLDVAHAEAAAIRDVVSGRYDLRLHVVGDCSTDESASVVSEAALGVLRKGRKAFSYTHAWDGVNREAWGGVSVLASCESPEQVLAAQAKGWATAVVVPEFTSERVFEDSGIRILPCPNQTRKVTCEECGLCKREGFLRAVALPSASPRTVQCSRR